MITIEQLNAVPRPGWLSPYESTSDIPGRIDAGAMDLRFAHDYSISIMGAVNSFRDAPMVRVYHAGRTFDERIEFLQHAKAIAALFVDPKVMFYR